MNETKSSEFTCIKCDQNKNKSEMMPLELLADPIVKFIKQKYSKLASEGEICLDCLNVIRAEYVQQLLAEEVGQLSQLEEDVVRSIHSQDLLARNLNSEFAGRLTLGQRVADKIAEFGGSWKFIFLFAATLFIWITANSTQLLRHSFDPYPFILLNLILSCLAAIQAPIIMMSQNRQAEKDRLQADQDYRTNLKSELEIRQLNWKIDQLMMHHWQRLLQIQEIQTELMEEIAQKKTDRSGKLKG